MTQSQKKRFISLWHPFTAESVGLTEDMLMTSHSRPHIYALQDLSNKLGWQCRVEYITENWFPSTNRSNDLEWKFWPVSFRWRQDHKRWRKQWSLLGLGYLAIQPADVSIFNTSGYGSSFTFKMAQVSRKLGKRYIAMMGGHNLKLNKALIDYYQNASIIVTHTHELKSRLQAMPELEKCAIRVFPLGVDCNYFKPASPKKDQIYPRLLYIGRISEWKQPHLALQATALVKTVYPDVQLNLIGPHSSQNYLDYLRKLAEEYGIINNVVFHGPINYELLPEWYQASDLFLMPSKGDGESFGMVAVESIACGTPVVAIKGNGGPNEILTHQKDGLLVDEAEYTNSVFGLVQKGEGYLQQMRIAAREKAVENYSREATARNLQEIVLEALEY